MDVVNLEWLCNINNRHVFWENAVMTYSWKRTLCCVKLIQRIFLASSSSHYSQHFSEKYGERETEQKAKTRLAHLNLKDVVESSISKASTLVRCFKAGFPFNFDLCLRNGACLSKYMNNENMPLINFKKVRNYSS